MCINLFKRDEIPIHRDLSDIKDICRILFIDDEEFEIVEILKKQGWEARRIEDVDNLDGADIRDNHIFFVDISGVGKKLNYSKEGLSIISEIKRKFPEKKVIAYSSLTQDAFDIDIKSADERISKNSGTREFQRVLEEKAQELFSYEMIKKRIIDLICHETGQTLPEHSIDKLLRRREIKQDYIIKKFHVAKEVAYLIINLILLFKAR